MAYISKRGRRPAEYASKSSHSHIINDPTVKSFLSNCYLPVSAENVVFQKEQNVKYEPSIENPIEHIIAVDGGYSEVPVRVEFPSSTICFFQFGALAFSVGDLESLDEQLFIDPDDIAKLKRIQRLKLAIPVRNMALRGESTLTDSVRKTLYDFFCQEGHNGSLIKTLQWFIFEGYKSKWKTDWQLASCPICRRSHIILRQSEMSNDYKFTCSECGGEILLTDVFRLHEVIDDEIGAGGILAYVTTTIEQIIIVHLIRIILNLKPKLLEKILFIKDGPLAFFGQTANMHKPMRSLVKFLFENHNLYLAGLEKTGAFVEHADEISKKLLKGSILILDNDYIYRYIIPGRSDPNNPYGRTTYYSNKVIFKTRYGSMYVANFPTTKIIPYPTDKDLKNLQVMLTNIEKLKCDMYDSALMPVALVNKLVSLSNHPSSQILKRFAVESM